MNYVFYPPCLKSSAPRLDRPWETNSKELSEFRKWLREGDDDKTNKQKNTYQHLSGSPWFGTAAHSHWECLSMWPRTPGALCGKGMNPSKNHCTRFLRPHNTKRHNASQLLRLGHQAILFSFYLAWMLIAGHTTNKVRCRTDFYPFCLPRRRRRWAEWARWSRRRQCCFSQPPVGQKSLGVMLFTLYLCKG